jgi:hypothetical protein
MDDFFVDVSSFLQKMSLSVTNKEAFEERFPLYTDE